MLGIGAETIPVGRSMFVCRARHQRLHNGVATEWFDYDRTTAMLPLAPGMQSVVLTFDNEQVLHLAAMRLERPGHQVGALPRHRWGEREAVGLADGYTLSTTFSLRIFRPGPP